MATFDHKIFLWNRDHNFKDYKNKEISVEELSKFLECDLVSEEEKIKVNDENLLVPAKTLTITKNGYLIVAKDKDGKIIIEDLDKLEIEPISIKEINFGWQIDKSFKYTTEDLQWAQDLQESAQALRIVGSPKKVEPTDKLKPQEFAESFIEDSYMDSASTNDCYWTKLSSFSGWSNGSNKLLEFLSWPNKTTVQLAPKQFFVSENTSDWGTHYDTRGIMNWGTNGPSLIGITCGNTETGTFENNVFTYENQEYLLPSGGQIIRILRQPADDLTLPAELNNALYQWRDEAFRHDPQLLFGYIPTLWGWVPTLSSSQDVARVYTENGDENNGYRVSLSLTKKLYPWIERSVATRRDGQNVYDAFFFLSKFYAFDTDLKEIYDRPEDTSSDLRSFDYWYNLMFGKNESWKAKQWDKQTAYVAEMNFNAATAIVLEDIALNRDPITLSYNPNHLLMKNHTYIYPISVTQTISEDRVNFTFKSFDKYYRALDEWKTEAEKTYIKLQINLNNFCLYPGENLEKLIKFKTEVQSFHGRNWSIDNTNNKDKNNPQNNYLGLVMKMHWTPHLINQATSEFLYPLDCRDIPTIPVTIGEYSGRLEQFQHWGCWDLLMHRITSLSCLVLFDNENCVTNKPNYYQFKGCSYAMQDDNPVLLWQKTMSPSDAPENNNFSALNAPLFYWPSMAKDSRVMLKWGSNDGHAITWGYEMKQHSSFAEKWGGYRKVGQDRGAVTIFVEPDALQPDFNTSSGYGWYWIDNSVHINIRYDEEQDEVRFQLINYSLSTLDAQIEAIEIEVPSLSTSEWKSLYWDETLSINQQLVFTVDDPRNYEGLWKIKSNNQVYKDNILYGKWTEEGIKPYNLTEGEN